MPRKSGSDKLVRVRAVDLPPPSPDHLAGLRAVVASGVPVDPGKPMSTGGRRVDRDATGRPVARVKGGICQLILAQLGRRQMTRYELYKRAKTSCPTLSESAVYEYLRGMRIIRADYLEALIHASGLEIRPKRLPSPPKGTRPSASASPPPAMKTPPAAQPRKSAPPRRKSKAKSDIPEGVV